MGHLPWHRLGVFLEENDGSLPMFTLGNSDKRGTRLQYVRWLTNYLTRFVA